MKPRLTTLAVFPNCKRSIAGSVLLSAIFACGPAGAAVVQLSYDYGDTLPLLPASGEWTNGEGWKPEICLGYDAGGLCIKKGYPDQQPVGATEPHHYKVTVGPAPAALSTTFTINGPTSVNLVGATFLEGVTVKLDTTLGFNDKDPETGEAKVVDLRNDTTLEVGVTGKLFSNFKARFTGNGRIRLQGGTIQAGQITNLTRIEGFGTFTGSGMFNQGIIDANFNSLPLVVQGTVHNTGEMRASGGGVLQFAASGGNLDSTLGDIAAGAGSTVEVLRSLKGGNYRTAETGQTVVRGSLSLRDFSTEGAGAMTITDGSNIGVFGDVQNNGRIVVDAASKQTVVNLNDVVSLAGTGRLVLGGELAYLAGGGASPTLYNGPQHWIGGAGSISYPLTQGYRRRMINQGIIAASTSGKTLSVNAEALENSGMLLATGGGTLKLSGAITNSGNPGMVVATDASVVLIDGATIQGGTLSALGTGVIRGEGLSSSLINLTNVGHVLVELGVVTLMGAISNSGTLELAGAPDKVASFAVRGPVVLSGGGVLSLRPGPTREAQSIRNAFGGGSVLNDSNHTIRGTGRFGYEGGIGITNRGLIEADGTGGLLVRGDLAKGGFVNEGTLRVADGSSLVIIGSLKNHSNGTLTGGRFEARGLLRLPAGVSVQQNAALLVLDGTASAILAGDTGSEDALSGFAANLAGGGLVLLGGREFNTVGALGNAGLVQVGAGSTLRVGPTGQSGYTQTGGATAGNGTLIASQVKVLGGTVDPGASIGTLTIDGDFELGETAVLRLEVGNVASGAYDRLVVKGVATLAGTVQIDPVAGFDGSLPFSLPVLSAPSISGTPKLPNSPLGSLAWQTGPEGIRLVFTPAPSQPRIQIRPHNGGVQVFGRSSDLAGDWIIEFSADLQQWQELGLLVPAGEELLIHDSPIPTHRFYRALSR